MSRLLDPKGKDGQFPFEYRDSATTDVRKTWERARLEQQKSQAKVCPMKRKESK